MSASCTLEFIDFNFPFQENVGITATSEDTEFLVSNLRLPFRSKLWRSGGHFLIDSTNNKIDFKESAGGGELTATLTQDAYATPTDLATEIKLQLETAGAEIYTVTYSALNGQWTIVSAGAFLSLLFATGSSGASTGPEIGFLSGDRTGALSYTGGVAIHSFERLVFDLKTTEPINCFAAIFDPRRGIRFSDEAVLKLQANATNEWSAPAVDVTLSIDNVNRLISNYFSTDQEYRFWSIFIEDKRNNDLKVELGSIVLGKFISLTGRNVSKGFGYRNRDQSRARSNAYGNVYADKFPRKRRLEFDYRNMPVEDLQTFISINEKVGTTDPVFAVFDREGVVFPDDLFTLYGRFTRQIEANHTFNKFLSASVAIEEYF